MLRLKIVGGRDLGRVFELETGQWVIGRDACDVILNDLRVDPQHGKLEVGDDFCIVEDNGSKGGLFVNERRVQKCAVTVGDSLRLGQTVLKLESPR